MPGREEIRQETQRRAHADLARLKQADGGLPDPGDEGGEYGQSDPAEKWGKLIGRGLGILFLVYLIYWLSTTIV